MRWSSPNVTISARVDERNEMRQNAKSIRASPAAQALRRLERPDDRWVVYTQVEQAAEELMCFLRVALAFSALAISAAGPTSAGQPTPPSSSEDLRLSSELCQP